MKLTESRKHPGVLGAVVHHPRTAHGDILLIAIVPRMSTAFNNPEIIKDVQEELGYAVAGYGPPRDIVVNYVGNTRTALWHCDATCD